MKQPSKSPDAKAPSREAGTRIPDKPRDCGPDVDTWPILDEQAGNTAKTKPGAGEKSRSGH